MRRPLVTRSLGIALSAGLVLGLWAWPPIRASQAPPSVVASAAVAGAVTESSSEPLAHGPILHLAAKPMTPEATRVWLKLQEKVNMSFPNDTPLEDVIKYIRQGTKDKDTFAEGIPIYVDPFGLQEADKTMASTIQIDLKGIPLATTLRLVLKQVGMVYRIEKEGFILITSGSSDDSPPDAESLILDNLSALRSEVKALRSEIRINHGHSGMDSGPIAHPPNSKPAGGMGSMGGMM